MLILFVLVSVIQVSQLEERCFTLNAVRLKGSRYAGLVEVCHFYLWRSVCGDDWTNTSAGVICRQLNYTDPEHQDHVACGYRCFGRTIVSSFALRITCEANHSNLQSCSVSGIDSSNCQANAGLFCDIAYSSPRIKPLETALPSSSPTSYSHPSCMKVAGSATPTVTLTVIIVTLTLILIGVGLGWVCTCYKWARNSHRFPVCSNNNEISNPTYDPDAKLKMNFYRESKSGQDYKTEANNENYKNHIQQKPTACTDCKSSAEDVTYNSITSSHEASIYNSHDNSYNIVNSVYERSIKAVHFQ